MRQRADALVFLLVLLFMADPPVGASPHDLEWVFFNLAPYLTTNGIREQISSLKGDFFDWLNAGQGSQWQRIFAFNSLTLFWARRTLP